MRFSFPHSHAFQGGRLTIEDAEIREGMCSVEFGDGTAMIGEWHLDGDDIHLHNPGLSHGEGHGCRCATLAADLRRERIVAILSPRLSVRGVHPMTFIEPPPMSRTKAIVYGIALPICLLALVFLPIGRLDWGPGWTFVGVLVVAFAASALVLQRVNPAIYRARSRFQPGTEGWVRMLLLLMMPAMVAEIPLATLDAGRLFWSAVPIMFVAVGYVLLIAGIAVTAWEQAVNRFFEPGVRLQKECGQHVISSGPYAFVRHPGYVGALMMFAGIALALGSWWALVPAAIAGALLVLRTSWEDALLLARLDGYGDYARRGRFRLVLGLW